MATMNTFALLGDDNDDPQQLIVKLPAAPANKKSASGAVTAKPAAKLPSKPLPPAQAVQEAKADGHRGGGRFGGCGGLTADFLPLEGGPARKLPITENSENKSSVLYIGRIPHGFYENEMEAFFKQFGEIKRIRIARNRMTGKAKHFGFVQFASPEVAKIVAETMHNYLLFEHLLQVQIIPPERVHPKLWKGVNRFYKPLDWVQIERKRHNKERTLEEHKKLVDGILKRDQKRRKKIEAAGIDYECPEIVGSDVPAPKKIKFED